MKWVDDVPALKQKYPPFETIIGTYSRLALRMMCTLHHFLIHSHARSITGLRLGCDLSGAFASHPSAL